MGDLLGVFIEAEYACSCITCEKPWHFLFDVRVAFGLNAFLLVSHILRSVDDEVLKWDGNERTESNG